MRHVFLAASKALWGVDDSTFEFGYIALIGVLWAGALLGRRWLDGRFARYAVLEQQPFLVAYLNDGPKLALLAALSWLRVAGLVGSQDGQLVRWAAAPDEARHPLLRAVLAELDRPLSREMLAVRAPVRDALNELYVELRRLTLFDAERRRRHARVLGLVMVPVVLLGVAWQVGSQGPGRPVLVFFLATIAAGAVGIGLWVSGNNLAPRASFELDRLRTKYARLRSIQRSRWTSYEAEAALAVALFGASTALTVDPQFASDLGVERLNGFGISSVPVMPRRSSEASSAGYDGDSGAITAWGAAYMADGGFGGGGYGGCGDGGGSACGW